jgi:predicted esterase
MRSKFLFAATAAFIGLLAPVNPARAQWQDMGLVGSAGVYGLCRLGDTLIAAASSGGVRISTDGGAVWQSRNNGLGGALVRAVATSGSLVFAGTLGNGVYRSSDAGASWSTQRLAGRYVQCLLTPGGRIFAGTENGVYRSSDDGSTWLPGTAGLTNLTITSLAARGDRIFAGTFGDGVFVSSDTGATWTGISYGLNAASILSLSAADNTLYAGTMGGGVFGLSDSTGRWSHLSLGLPGSNVNALLTISTRVLAGTNQGNVYSSASGWVPDDVVQQEVREPASYNYLLFLPRNRSLEVDGKLPLILFLHGIDALDGAVGGPSDLGKVKKEGLPALLDKNNEFPAIVVSPQCPASTEWYYEDIDNNALMNRLLDSLIQRYPVDPSRITITGLSMGGIGSWYFAMRNPTRFAAIVPIASRRESNWDVCTIKDSVWAFHGADDSTVPLWKGEDVVNALRACGGTPRFTVYPGVGHDCWTITYARQDLYEWIYLQKRR